VDEGGAGNDQKKRRRHKRKRNVVVTYDDDFDDAPRDVASVSDLRRRGATSDAAGGPGLPGLVGGRPPSVPLSPGRLRATSHDAHPAGIEMPDEIFTFEFHKFRDFLIFQEPLLKLALKFCILIILTDNSKKCQSSLTTAKGHGRKSSVFTFILSLDLIHTLL